MRKICFIMRMAPVRAAISRARHLVFAACLFSGLVSAQQVIGVYNGAVTPFGTAVGQTGGFSGSFQPSMPLYHVGGRGEAGTDLIWNFQPNWQAYKQFGGSTPFVSIDPYPSNNIVTGASPLRAPSV